MSPHPLEQLRYVARGWELGDEFPAREVAMVLGELAEEAPASLLQACRRMIEYFPASGPVWWLSARALSAADPVEGILDAAEELASDPTARLLAKSLPPSAPVAVLVASQAVRAALRPARDLVRGNKARGAGVVVACAMAAGPGSLLLPSNVAAAAVNAAGSGRAVWAVVERGVLLPAALWDQLLGRALGPGGLAGAVTPVPASDFAEAVGERGKAPVDEVLSAPTCPAVAELLGWKG